MSVIIYDLVALVGFRRLSGWRRGRRCLIYSWPDTRVYGPVSMASTDLLVYPGEDFSYIIVHYWAGM